MSLVDSVFFRLSKLFIKNYDAIRQEKFIAGTIAFITAQKSVEEKTLLKQLFFQNRMRALPVIPFDDRLRQYGWLKMIEQIKSVEGDIVEAGVGYGNTFLTLVLGNTFFNTNKKLYAFDSFGGFPEANEKDRGSRVTDTQKVTGWEDASEQLIGDSMQFFKQNSTLTIDPNSIIYRKGFFNETMPAGLPEKISLLHVDNDLYDGVLHVLNACHPRLSIGGLVVFDEYHDKKWPGVKKAVDEFVTANHITLQYFPELLRFGYMKS